MRTLAIIILGATTVPALADPSFDCTKASTPVEKTICKDENTYLAYRDTVLAELYADLKEQGGYEKVLGGQPAWLKARDACGADAACLTRQYDRRIAELARAAGDEGAVTGTYDYSTTYDSEQSEDGKVTDSGEAFVVRMNDGTLSGYVDTVSGPTFHTCNLEFDSAEAMGDAWLWTGSSDEQDFEGKTCRVLLRSGKASLRIDSLNCTYFCGARGYFDETYAKVK